MTKELNELGDPAGTNYGLCPSDCCVIHGCKYGLKGCPVKHVQVSYNYCEQCSLERAYVADEAAPELRLARVTLRDGGVSEPQWFAKKPGTDQYYPLRLAYTGVAVPETMFVEPEGS